MVGGHAWLGGHAWQGGVCGGGHAWWGCAWFGAYVVVVGGCAWQILRDTVNERVVRILLECILVEFYFCFFKYNSFNKTLVTSGTQKFCEASGLVRGQSVSSECICRS